MTDAVRDAAWTTVEITGRRVRKLAPEGLYGRRKMIALIRRTELLNVSRGSIDRAMRALGLSGTRRDKSIRTTIPVKDGIRAELWMALWERARQGHPITPKQLRAHSHAGSQYVSVAYTDKLALDGIAPSIGSVGDAYDNALMETINGLYNTECIRTTVFHDGPYKTIGDVEFATAGWVDWFNNRRLHSSLGYVPPVEFEQAHYAALNREPQPA